MKMRLMRCVWTDRAGTAGIGAEGKDLIPSLGLCGTVTGTGGETRGTGPFGSYTQRKLTGKTGFGTDAGWALYSFDSGALGIRLTLTNTSPAAMTLGTVALLSFGGKGFALGGEPAGWRVYVDSGGCGGDCASHGLTENGGVHRSCGLAVLWSPLSGLAFACGQAEIEKTLTDIKIKYGGTHAGVYCWSDADAPEITVTQDAEGYELDPGETFACDTVMLMLADDPFFALTEMADSVAAGSHIRGFTKDDVAVGWMTWYNQDRFTRGAPQKYECASEKVTLEQAGHIRRLGLDACGVRDIITDDGYQKEVHLGDWLEAAPTYPDGMGKHAEKLISMGMKPGIWLTPFIVTEDSAVFQQHPEWCVDYGDGKPRAAFDWYHANPPVYAYELDPTVPGAMEWIENVFRTFYAWGYRFFKSDFSGSLLYTGGRKFHDIKMTGLMRWRWAWRRIREATGADANLQLCGANNIGAAGIVDSVRTGSDIGGGVSDAQWNAIRNGSSFENINRWWQNGRWFITDADNLLIAEYKKTRIYAGVADMRHKLSLSMREARVRAVMLFATGGNIILGDRLEELEEEKLGIIRSLLPVCGISARPADMFRRKVPYILHHRFVREWGSWDVVSVINYGDEALAEAVALDTLGLDVRGRYAVYEFWTGQVMKSLENGVLYASVPPHDARTFRLTALKPGAAELTGSSFHLSMGMTEIQSLVRRPDGSLRVRFTRPQPETGFCFYVRGSDEAVIKTPVSAGPEGTETVLA